MTPTDNADTPLSWRNAITTNPARPFPLCEALKPNPVASDSTREAFIAIPATLFSTREAPNPNAAKPFSICEVSTVKEITNS